MNACLQFNTPCKILTQRGGLRRGYPNAPFRHVARAPVCAQKTGRSHNKYEKACLGEVKLVMVVGADMDLSKAGTIFTHT